MSNYDEFIERIKKLDDEKLIDIYCDWKTMGYEPWQFNAVQKELNKRAEEEAAEEAFGRFEWNYNPYNGFESVD